MVVKYCFPRVVLELKGMVGQAQENPTKKSLENSHQTEFRPYVLAEVLLEQEWLLLVVRNIGLRPAVDLHIRWEPRFSGLGGEQATSELPLFRELSYLGPGREICTLLDSRQAYFARGEPARLVAYLQYRDEQGSRYQHTIRHNLEVFRDLALPVRFSEGQKPHD